MEQLLLLLPNLLDQAQRSIQSIDLALQKMGFNPEAGDAPQTSEPLAAATAAAVGPARTIDLGTNAKRKRSA